LALPLDSARHTRRVSGDPRRLLRPSSATRSSPQSSDAPAYFGRIRCSRVLAEWLSERVKDRADGNCASRPLDSGALFSLDGRNLYGFLRIASARAGIPGKAQSVKWWPWTSQCASECGCCCNLKACDGAAPIGLNRCSFHSFGLKRKALLNVHRVADYDPSPVVELDDDLIVRRHFSAGSSL